MNRFTTCSDALIEHVIQNSGRPEMFLLDSGYTQEEIRAAHKKMVLMLHPDKCNLVKLNAGVTKDIDTWNRKKVVAYANEHKLSLDGYTNLKNIKKEVVMSHRVRSLKQRTDLAIKIMNETRDMLLERLEKGSRNGNSSGNGNGNSSRNGSSSSGNGSYAEVEINRTLRNLGLRAIVTQNPEMFRNLWNSLPSDIRLAEGATYFVIASSTAMFAFCMHLNGETMIRCANIEPHVQALLMNEVFEKISPATSVSIFPAEIHVSIFPRALRRLASIGYPFIASEKPRLAVVDPEAFLVLKRTPN